MAENTEWFEDYSGEEDIQVREYDITATPNDFNVATLFSFIESGAISVPGFQRNFVWDIKRSSKLIESLILGLPVPQLFLYQEDKNKFLVIDGQQRLMSIYYFIKQRYPRKEKRGELRTIFEKEGRIPDHVLHNDEFFTNFRLQLPGRLPDKPNPYSHQSYTTLGDAKIQLDLRPIRNVVVRQNSPENDNSSVFEIFSRLNSGGVNLRPQEIRSSLYHSVFYDLLMKLNTELCWRKVLANPTPDLHLKDVEILLRIFAMMIDRNNYAPSMVKFLNKFSLKCKGHTLEQNQYLEQLFKSFLEACSDLPEKAFASRKSGKFSIALIEAVFTAASKKAFQEKRCLNGKLDGDQIDDLANDAEFLEAAIEASTQSSNVKTRLKRGEHFISPL